MSERWADRAAAWAVIARTAGHDAHWSRPPAPAGDEREPRWGRLPMFPMWRATKPG